jgi:hypothetical protein
MIKKVFMSRELSYAVQKNIVLGSKATVRHVEWSLRPQRRL